MLTENEYLSALARADKIFSAERGTPEGNELYKLSLLIEEYEDVTLNQYFPDFVTPPGETVEEALDTMRLDREPFADLIDGAPITEQRATDLEAATGVPVSFWLNTQKRYDKSLKETEGTG